MACGLSIQQAQNNHDGVSATVQVTGTPSGAVSFIGSPYNDVGSAAALPSSGAGPSYIVTVQYPAGWYIWASDDSGVTAVAGACWVGVSDDPYLNQIGDYLEQYLVTNKPLVDAAIASALNGAKSKQIFYGTARSIIDFPSVVVTNPSLTWEWAAMPATKLYTFRHEIFILWTHQEASPIIKLATRLSGRIMDVLNAIEGARITLADGTIMTDCQCNQGSIEDVELSDKKFGAMGSCIFTCQGVIQDWRAML